MEETIKLRESFVKKIKWFLTFVSNSRENNKDDAVWLLEGFSHMATALLADLNKGINEDLEQKRQIKAEGGQNGE